MRYYLRLLSYKSENIEVEAKAIQSSFEELGLEYDSKPHIKGGMSVVIHTDIPIDNIISVLEKNGLRLVM